MGRSLLYSVLVTQHYFARARLPAFCERPTGQHTNEMGAEFGRAAHIRDWCRNALGQFSRFGNIFLN